MPRSKAQTIWHWKRSGLIYDNYDELYEAYIKTSDCQHCKTEFTKKNKRCMDHSHETGLFRKIICNRCNTCDSYIKYPNGYTEQDRKERIAEYQKKYQERNRESILKYKNQKVKCECGCIVTMSNFSTHKKSKKHIKYIAGYI